MYASGSSSDETTTVVVQGLDSDFVEITGYATLNEVNPVALNDSDGSSLSFYRVFRAWNSGSTDLTGAFYVSDSDATLTAGVPAAGEKYAKVDSDHQQTLMAMYTVPAGKSLILYHIGIECTANTAAAVSTTPQAAQVSLRYRENGGVWRTKETYTAITLGSNVVDHFFPARAAIPAETDIELYIYGATTTMGVDGRFWGVLGRNRSDCAERHQTGRLGND
jgi:hypothetical protein